MDQFVAEEIQSVDQEQMHPSRTLIQLYAVVSMLVKISQLIHPLACSVKDIDRVNELM